MCAYSSTASPNPDAGAEAGDGARTEPEDAEDPHRETESRRTCRRPAAHPGGHRE